MTTLAIFVVLFTLLQLIIAAVNLIFKPDLTRGKHPADLLISVLIPARNEEKNLGYLLNDLVNQHYKSIEIIVFDDQSEDRTAQIVEEFSESDRRVRIVRSVKLPEGWLGKNYACHSLSAEAKGDWLLFLDADVRVGKDLLHLTTSYATRFNLGLLSIFPKQLMVTSGEKMTIPVMNYILLSLLPLPLVLWSRFPSLAAANGQFMLFNSQIYRRLYPHERMKKNKVEDIAIARYFKQKGILVACLTGINQIQCRMYSGYQEAVNGFSKNITAFFGNSFLLAIIFWFITTLGFIPVFIALPLNISILYLVIYLVTRMVISKASNQNIGINIICLIPQQVSMGFFMIRSLTNKYFYNYQWKGRDIG